MSETSAIQPRLERCWRQPGSCSGTTPGVTTRPRPPTRRFSTSSPWSRRKDDDGEDSSPPKQTVSVKTVTVSGVSGVLESEADVDRYLAALRTALLATLNDGKRISL